VFTPVQRLWNLHVRTVLPILVWVAVALLILNIYLRSGWIFLVSITLVSIAVVIYFIPVIRARVYHTVRWKSVYGEGAEYVISK